MGQTCSGDAERKHPKVHAVKKTPSPPCAPIARPNSPTSPSPRRERSERAGSLPQSRSLDSATEQTPAPSAASCSPESVPLPRILVPPVPAVVPAGRRGRTHAPPSKPEKEKLRRTETRRAAPVRPAAAPAPSTATRRPAANVYAGLLSGAGELLEPPPTTALPSASEPASFRDAGRAVDAIWAAPVARRCLAMADNVEQQREKLAAAALVAPMSPARAGRRSADKRPQRPSAGQMRSAAKAAEGRRRELEDTAAVLLTRAPHPLPVEETLTEDLVNARFLHEANCEVWHADLQRTVCSDFNSLFAAAQGEQDAAEAPPPPPQLGLTLPDGSAASLQFSKWERRALPAGSAVRTAAPIPALREPPAPTAQRRAAGHSHDAFAPAVPPLQGAGRRVRQATSRLPWR